MAVLRRHLGEWISIHVHFERAPLRMTLSIALGELPETWPTPAHGRSIVPWAGIAGLALIGPFVLLISATLVRQILGLSGPYDLIASSPVAILAATISLFVGLPVAFAMNAWPIVRLGLRREAGGVEALVALEIAPLQLAVVVIALVVASLFVGHLATDSYACLNGVRSAC